MAEWRGKMEKKGYREVHLTTPGNLRVLHSIPIATPKLKTPLCYFLPIFMPYHFYYFSISKLKGENTQNVTSKFAAYRKKTHYLNNLKWPKRSTEVSIWQRFKAFIWQHCQKSIPDDSDKTTRTGERNDLHIMTCC